MNKELICFVVLVYGFVCPALASTKKKRYTPSNINFITPDYKSISEPKKNIFSLYQFPGWYKPISPRKKFLGSRRLVLKLKNDGRATLNPQNEGLASTNVIDLTKLKPTDAENLWGKPRKSNGVMTFDLISSPSTIEKDIYHLDMIFENEKLKSYRIRGIGISIPEWQETSNSIGKNKEG